MKYYEVKGKTRLELLQDREERQAQFKLAKALSKRLGADRFHIGVAFGSHYIFGFEFKKGREPDPKSKQLRKYYDRAAKKHRDDVYVPAMQFKEGKALHTEMSNIHLGGGTDVAKIVKMNMWGGSNGLTWVTPGLHVFGPKQRVFISTRENEPKSKDCVRVADLTFEKLEKKYDPQHAKRSKARKDD